MSKKLHILFLSDFVPSPRSGSATSQLYAYYIEGLRRRGYDVSFVALARAHERHLADDLLQQVTYRQVVPIAQDLFARMGRLVRRVIDPAEYALVHSSGLDSILLDVMRRQRFDLIHANHPWLVHAARRALRRLSNAVRPVLIGQVTDIITALRFQHIYSAPRPVRPLYLLSFARAAYCEFINYSLTDGLIVHNTKDAEVIKILLPNSNNVFISPAWFDFIEEICDGYRERKGNKILFIGNFNDKRTKEGMAWFTDRVLPNLLQAINNLEVNLVGVKDKKSEDVFCTKEYIKCYGYQSHSDFLAFYDSASVLIFPLQFGRYSCHLKVLNAFARGLPVVMTSWANSGAEAVPGEEALVADTPEAFAECIIRLLRDPALAARIAEGGLRRIRREYPSPSVVLDSLEQAYQTAITQKEYRR